MEGSHEGGTNRKIGGYVKVEEGIKYLLRLSEAKLVLVSNLLEITKEQREILHREEEEALEASLQKRQVVMGKIDVLDKEFLEKYNTVKKELGVESLQDFQGEFTPDLKALKEKITDIMKKIEETQLLDKSNTEKLRENMNKVQENIRTLKNNKKVVAGYKGYQGETHSLFLDKKK